MTDLELTRTSGDRRLYSLEGIGTVRLDGLFSGSATAERRRTPLALHPPRLLAAGHPRPGTRRERWWASSCHATSGVAARCAGAIAS